MFQITAEEIEAPVAGPSQLDPELPIPSTNPTPESSEPLMEVEWLEEENPFPLEATSSSLVPIPTVPDVLPPDPAIAAEVDVNITSRDDGEFKPIIIM